MHGFRTEIHARSVLRWLREAGRTFPKKTLKNGHAKHIHANCDCEYAIRFDTNTNVEGYDPDALYEQYKNASSSGSPKDKINALRRMQYASHKDQINAQKRAAYLMRNVGNDLRQHKPGAKVIITNQAITKIKNIGPSWIEDEKKRQIAEMNRQILTVAMNENDSNEVAMMLLGDGSISKALKGKISSVDVTADPDFSHTLRTAPMRSITISHNHPGLTDISIDDLGIFVQYPSIETMEVVTNQGKTFYISKKANYDDEKALEIFKNTIRDNVGKSRIEILEKIMSALYNYIERGK